MCWLRHWVMLVWYRDMTHIPVLLQEVVHFATEGLRHPAVIVDGTINGGGHAQAICEVLQPGDSYVGCDVDRLALDRSKKHLSSLVQERSLQLIQYHGSFDEIPQILERYRLMEPDCILLDLGWSMDQFVDGSRGFSFQVDGPLDMRLVYPPKPESLSAADIVATYSRAELQDLLAVLGEEPHAAQIAEAICVCRKRKPITTTKQLATVIESVVPRHGKTHPATKTFQALRIAVNGELSILRCIPDLAASLCSGGKLMIITFHSLEDRIVKNSFKGLVATGGFKLVNKNTIKPSREEILKNPRSRSAQLRVIQSVR